MSKNINVAEDQYTASKSENFIKNIWDMIRKVIVGHTNLYRN